MKKQTVLIVDDTPDNIEVVRGILRADYTVMAALNGRKALSIAEGQLKPDLILLDVMMPEMDGYEVCHLLKSNPDTKHIPVIFVSAKGEEEDEALGLSLGAVDYLSKPIKPSIVKARVRTHLALSDQSRQLEAMVFERTQELVETRQKIIQRLGRAAEFRDNETGLHVIRMSQYSYLLAQSLNVSKAWAELILQASPMHDVGKIGIPDEILLKPGKLTESEREVMQKHPEFGAEIIGDDASELMQMAKEIALTHHEKWDGSGYPHGLAGDDIPLSGRIVAVADVFDALTSERPYKKAWTVEDAVSFIVDSSGKHFDPTLIEHFRKVLPECLDIKVKYAEQEHSFSEFDFWRN